MMRQFKFLNVFLMNFSVLFLTISLIGFALRHHVDVNDLWEIKIGYFPLGIYILIVLTLISFFVSSLFFYGLKVTQQRIVQKLQWLNAGNYTHASFDSTVRPSLLLSAYSDVVDEQLNTLSKKLAELLKDWQQWHAVTASISNEDKDQIIEAERHRIARELHDSVSQQLFAASMLLSTVKLSLSEKEESVSHQLVMIEQTIHQAQTELRALLLHLRPINLEGKTLQEGITYLLNELQHKVNITMISTLEDVRLESVIEDHMFRIVQELLSNVLRHAKATKIEVYLQQHSDYTIFRLIDNGIGFDEASRQSGYGLLNIRERVSSMGGTLSIVSVLNQGTVVDIKLSRGGL